MKNPYERKDNPKANFDHENTSAEESDRDAKSNDVEANLLKLLNSKI